MHPAHAPYGFLFCEDSPVVLLRLNTIPTSKRRQESYSLPRNFLPSMSSTAFRGTVCPAIRSRSPTSNRACSFCVCSRLFRPSKCMGTASLSPFEMVETGVWISPGVWPVRLYCRQEAEERLCTTNTSNAFLRRGCGGDSLLSC